MHTTLQNLHASLSGSVKSSVLVVMSDDNDFQMLQEILTARGCALHACSSLAAAKLAITSSVPSVIICERDLPDGSWRRLLPAMDNVAAAPPLLVTSRFADEQLWAEVLNLGGYDVLLKPFDRAEVARVVDMALRCGMPSLPAARVIHDMPKASARL
jgi:DNA-binding response OmpR family regulator